MRTNATPNPISAIPRAGRYTNAYLPAPTRFPSKWNILHRRIAEAKLLLSDNSDLKVTFIAGQVGFSDFALFNRNFKHITGLNPAVYRKISHMENTK